MCRPDLVTSCGRSRYPTIVSTTAAVDPGARSSARRTAFFSGSTYVPRPPSGNRDVLHRVAPMVASTRTEPNPRSRPRDSSAMSSATEVGTLTKNQAAAPSCSQTSAWNENLGAGTARTLRRDRGTSAGAAVTRDRSP